MVSAGSGRLPWSLFPQTLLLSIKREASKLLFAAWKHSQSGEGKLVGLGGSKGWFCNENTGNVIMNLGSQTSWVHSRTPDSLDDCSSLVLVFIIFFF